MDNFESKLKILLDVLEKKKESLAAIINITENQETVLQAAEEPEGAVFLREMNKEKAVCIDQVLKADEVFQGIFNSLEDFEERAVHHKELVAQLQQSIKQVMDLDVKIRVLESRNQAAAAKAKPAFQGRMIPKQYMLDQYAKQNPKAKERR